MSFWFYGKKRDGKRSLYSVSAPILTLPFIVGALIAILLPIIQSCSAD
jgi:hypothetical protein